MTYYDILFSFFIYGFLGWCAEVAFAAFKQHSFVNRGFLNGPICPIYGIGVTVVVASLQPYVGNLILLYIASTILAMLMLPVYYSVMSRKPKKELVDLDD